MAIAESGSGLEHGTDAEADVGDHLEAGVGGAADDRTPPTSGSRWDASDVNVSVVLVMLLITVVVSVMGWRLRPGTTTYPAVPRRLAISVVGDVGSLSVELRRTGATGAVLTIYDDDRALNPAGAGVTADGWRVGLDGLGTGVVQRRAGTGLVPIVRGESRMDHRATDKPAVTCGPTPRLTDVGHVAALQCTPRDADAGFYLRIRWRTHAPLQLDGAYLSAQLPALTVAHPDGTTGAVPVTETVAPGAGDVGRFSIQATKGPSTTDVRTWTWDTEATARTASARLDPIAFSAVNQSDTQNEIVRVFLAGVLLGIAGGALITLVVELAKLRRIHPVRPRRDA